MLRAYIWVLAGLLLPVLASGQTAVASARGPLLDGYYFLGPDCALPQRIRVVTMLHSDSAIDCLAAGTTIEGGSVVARVQPLPAIRSVYYGTDLAASEAAYDAGDFRKAAALLREAVQKESDNPFVLNAYARALYQVNATKSQSYTAYQALFRLQQAQYKGGISELPVDHWFLESYWKFGTLCLDKAQWEAAVLAIERFLASGHPLAEENPLLLEQALGYLTEAFYQLHRWDLCRYYGQRTQQLFPANQYVKPYLVALPKAKRVLGP